MRNAVVPLVSSHLYNFGNNEAHQVPGFNVLFAIDNKINGHDSGNSLYWDSNQMRSGGLISLPNYQYQQAVSSYHEPTYSASPSPCTDSIPQQSMVLSKNFSFPEIEMGIQTEQMKKRSSTEITSMFPAQRALISTDCSGNKTVLSEWKRNKRTKVSNNYADQFHQSIHHTTQQQHKLQVPVRRSQKLSDKITSLQKLVSPYGKTDTASVLQEASLYIKLLHDQIQNLYEMLSSSYNSNVTPLQLPQDFDDNKLLNLRNRGLCLAPISFSQKMAQEEDRISSSPNNDYYSRSTNNFFGSNF